MTGIIRNSFNSFDLGYALQNPLNQYQGKVIQTFHKLPSESKLKEIIIRIIRIVIAPIAYPLLGLASLCGKLLFGRVSLPIKTQVNDAFVKTKKPYRQEDATKLANKVSCKNHHVEPLVHPIAEPVRMKNTNWQDEIINYVKKTRYDNHDDELIRLRSRGILTPEREAMLDNSISKVWKTSSSLLKQKQSKVLIGQALEIKDIFHSTHDVFIHAQATQWVVLTYLIKEMIKKFNPELDVHHFKFLRNPSKEIAKPELKSSSIKVTKPAKPLSMCGRITQTFKHLFGCSKEKKEEEPDVRDYLKSKLWINDGNMQTQEELLSTDGYFYNFSYEESSLYFLINNTNIMQNTAVIEKFAGNVFKQFCPSLKDLEINHFAKKVVKAAYKGDSSGNLFTLLIPKKESEKAQYRAHPFGAVCNCHSQDKSKKVLAKLQNEIFDHTNKCKPLFGYPTVPQFRIYTPTLTPGKGKKIFLLTPFAKQERKKVKAQIKSVVSEAYEIVKVRQ